MDYNSTIPIIDQINHEVISVIKRIQGPVLNLMHLYDIQDVSSYCGKIDTVNKICSIYQPMSKQRYTKLNELTWNCTDEKMRKNDSTTNRSCIGFECRCRHNNN